MIFDRNYRDIHRNRRIFKTLRLPEIGKVIDVSCGGGRLLKNIENHCPNLDLIGADITPGFLAKNPHLSKISFILATADALPFAANTFEVTLCSLSLHHYKNINAVLAEINRITKPGGKIYLTDIFPSHFWSQKIYNFIKCREPYHFEKFYTEQELQKLLREYNLNIKQTFPISRIPRILTLQIKKN